MREFPRWARAARWALVAAALTACASTPPPEAPARARAPIQLRRSGDGTEAPALLRADVARAAKVGEELYRHVDASRTAADALTEAGVLPGERRARAWLVRREAGGFRIELLDADERPAHVLHAVHVRPDAPPRVESPTPPAALDPVGTRMLGARALALARGGTGCTVRTTPVVLHGSVDGSADWLVYVLASADAQEARVLGGHARYRISADASELLEQLELSRSCLTVEVTEAERGTPLALSHALSSAPLETHVFTSLLYGQDVLVHTDIGVWRVRGTQVRYLGPTHTLPLEPEPAPGAKP